MAAIKLGEALKGSGFTIRENGTEKNYIVLHHGAYTVGEGGLKENYVEKYAGFDNVTLVLRVNVPYKAKIGNSDKNYLEENLRMAQNLQPYLDTLPEDILALMREVTVPLYYYVQSPGIYYLRTFTGSAFLPSPFELADIFPEQEQKIALLDETGEPIKYFTRDTDGSHSYDASCVAIDVDGSESWSYVLTETGYRPVLALDSNLAWITEDGELVANTAPAITGEDGDLGSFGETAPTWSYTVTDLQGDVVSVTETLDGAELRAFSVVLGQENTLSIPADVYRRTLNGEHTLTVTAEDSVGSATVRTLTFTKNVTSCAFTQTESFPADDRPTRLVAQIHGAFPAGSTLKVEACCNGNDASPVWEDITQPALLGQRYFFKNEEKTAASWGVRLRASLARGTAEGDCHISSIGGVFQ